jgi:hypothetical protein
VAVEGTFTIFDISDYISMDEGDFCEGEGGYGDLNASTRVIITNLEGDSLDRTSLGRGEATGAGSCEFAFEFTITDGEEGYVVAVGRRGETDYEFEDLRDDGVSLTIGL